MPEATYDLRSNAQLTYQSLRIGMAGIKPADYVDATGASRHGLTAGLWIYNREDSSQDRAVRVYAGQALTVAGYQIEVLDIRPDKPGTVKLRLSPAPAPG